jgi:hypothetical protein
MKIPQMIAWNLYHAVSKVHKDTQKGSVLYPFGRNLTRLQASFDACMEWIKADKLDHKWKGDTLPFSDKAFVTRFNNYLNTEVTEFEPYRFDGKEVMSLIDGITGEEERIISLLYIGNEVESKEPTTEVAEESTSS